MNGSGDRRAQVVRSRLQRRFFDPLRRILLLLQLLERQRQVLLQLLATETQFCRCLLVR